jgi:hypothetical protein
MARYTKEQFKKILEENGLSFTRAGKACGFTPQRARKLAEFLGLRVNKTIQEVEPTAKRRK